MINFVLATVVVFLGVIFGGLLVYIAPEEIKGGKRYFLISYHSLLLSVLGVSLLSFLFFERYEAVLAVSLIALLISFVLLRLDYKMELSYALVALLVVLSAFDERVFLIVSSMVFILGFFIGTIHVSQFVKNMKIKKKFLSVFGELILRYSGFLGLALVFLFLS